jgi:hypothetical protein
LITAEPRAFSSSRRSVKTNALLKEHRHRHLTVI